MSELRFMCSTHAPKVVAITETWLHPGVSDSEVALPGMLLYRSDRLTGNGGGSAIYISSSLPSSPVLDPVLSALPDSVFCQICLNPSTTILIGVIYRPPSSPPSAHQALLDALDRMELMRISNILLLGDFNFPNFDIDLDTSSACSSAIFTFTQRVQRLNYSQHVSEPTRLSPDGAHSRLDLVFTNEPLMVASIKYLPPLGNSDHLMLLFDYIGDTEILAPSPITKRLYFRADYPSIDRQLASISCPHRSTFPSLDAHWQFLCSLIFSLIKQFVP